MRRFTRAQTLADFTGQALANTTASQMNVIRSTGFVSNTATTFLTATTVPADLLGPVVLRQNEAYVDLELVAVSTAGTGSDVGTVNGLSIMVFGVNLPDPDTAIRQHPIGQQGKSYNGDTLASWCGDGLAVIGPRAQNAPNMTLGGGQILSSWPLLISPSAHAVGDRAHMVFPVVRAIGFWNTNTGGFSSDNLAGYARIWPRFVIQNAGTSMIATSFDVQIRALIYEPYKI